MTDQEIVDFWTVGQLHRWSARDLEGLPIASSTSEFLHDVGLPSPEVYTISFDPTNGLPQLPSRQDYRVLGYDDVVPICIVPARGDAVVVVEDEIAGGRRDRYMNRDPRALAATLVAYERYRRSVIGLDDAQAQRLIDTVSAEMSSIDASAFARDDHYWPVMIEQMRHGLL